jgi:aminoglycoside/choline kinase family phosphotransferase
MQVHGQDALDLKSGSYSWLTIGEVLRKNGIFVPKIHSLLKEFDSLLIEDFGDTTLDLKIGQLNDSEILTLYCEATKIISGFITIKPDLSSSWSKRGFDYTLLHKELTFFRSQYLENLPKFQTNRDTLLFSQEIESLSRYICQLPQYFAHRDFHSRNLMYFNENLGVIDFQDARWGPAAYDLSSLCFDPYVPLSLDSRRKIFNEARRVLDKNVSAQVQDEIKSSWHAVALQRMLKAIGSFAFLTRKGKRNYLVYITPTLTILNHFLPSNSQWPYLVDELIPRLLKLPNEKTA